MFTLAGYFPLSLLCILACPSILFPQEVDVRESYDKSTVMIPARDGIKLFTEIYSPREPVAGLPIIFLRTPYGVADPNGGFTRHFDSTFRELAKQGYIFAVQDARGRHGSEGKFE